jgi:hypothetical protein
MERLVFNAGEKNIHHMLAVSPNLKKWRATSKFDMKWLQS